MKKHIPNLITSLNVICGALAIIMIMNERIMLACYLILLAMIFDFLDGMVARLLHVKSDIGKELDSLADMVSFGLVPALLAHVLIKNLCVGEWNMWDYLLVYLPLIMPAFSAYRLAKFNLDTRQTLSFIGMPTPANALFWLSLVFTASYTPDFYISVWGHPWLLGVFVVLFSVLLIVELPMFSLKITDFSWKTNKVRYLYLGALVLLLAFFRLKAVSFAIPLYILFSLMGMRKKTND